MAESTGKQRNPPYKFIADGLRAGEVIPFFGAAASAVYRPQNETWQPGKPFMPFGSELARILASDSSYPASDAAYNLALADLLGAVRSLGANIPADQVEATIAPVLREHVGRPPDLALIASWAEHVQGHRRAVNRELRQSFAVEAQPGLLHTLLAGIEGTQVYITTNYDDLLERALTARTPHVIVDRGEKGLWVAAAGGISQRVASTGRELHALLNNPRTLRPSHPIIFKMHGSIDRAMARNDSYLITEEDYVDFLGRAGGSYVPPYIAGLIEGKDFLFLGYSLEDWNVRVILRKLLKRARQTRDGQARDKETEATEDPIDEEVEVRFWAIVRGRSDVEQEVWQAQNLNIYPMDLCKFAEELANRL
jgi:hypothetical protein